MLSAFVALGRLAGVIFAHPAVIASTQYRAVASSAISIPSPWLSYCGAR